MKKDRLLASVAVGSFLAGNLLPVFLGNAISMQLGTACAATADTILAGFSFYEGQRILKKYKHNLE